MLDALNLTTSLIEEKVLNISPSKLSIVQFTKMTQLEGLGALNLRDKVMQLAEEVKNWGETLDTSLN